MAHSGFIAAAFVITAIGTSAIILQSWLAMRKSEALSDDLRDRR